MRCDIKMALYVYSQNEIPYFERTPPFIIYPSRLWIFLCFSDDYIFFRDRDIFRLYYISVYGIWLNIYLHAYHLF